MVAAGCALAAMFALPEPVGAATTGLEPLGSFDRPLSGVFNGDGPQTAFSSPAIGDIAGDVEPELVIGNLDGTVDAYSLSGDRSLVWRVNLGATAVQSTPTLVDLSGDGKADVVVGTMDGRVVWLDGPTGAVVRTYTQGAPQHCPVGTDCRPDGFFASPAVVDLDGNGELDIIAPSYDHSVYAWTASGKLLWRRYIEDTLWSSPVVVDIDRDGKNEIVLGGDIWAGNPLNVPEGGLVWILRRDGSTYPGYPRSTPGQTVWSSPAVVDLNADGQLDVVVGTGRNWPDPAGRKVDAFTARTGKDLPGWPVAVEGRVVASPAIGDLDGDGRLDVSVAADHGWVYAFAADGRRLWRICNGPTDAACTDSYSTEGGSAIADVDADGQQEVVSTLDRHVRVFDGATGAVEAAFQMPTTMFPTGTTPSIAEVQGRVLIAQAGIARPQVGFGLRPGDLTKVFLFSTGQALCRADWPQFHRDAANTGRYVAEHLRWTPFHCPKDFLTRQYADFLGRPSDPSGAAYWTRRMRSGTSGATVIRSFLGSNEFGGVVAPVLRSYLAIHGTYPPTTAVVTDAVARVRAGATAVEIADDMAAAPDVAALGNAEFVTRLWQNAYGRSPSGSERTAALDALRSGTTRGALVVQHAHGAAGVRFLAPQVNVAMTYHGMLGRAPDPNGWAYWVAKVKVSNLDQLVTGFQRSSEYARRISRL
ncbi:MAG TPA: FG-GAP-like repeat-containing protein [Acidimicrobiales bacterium]|nr:FG-GAP-like repeat-containing protein [Acidimicrobiales bacterium]